MITAKEVRKLSIETPEEIKLNFKELKLWLSKEIRRCAVAGRYDFDIDIFSNRDDIAKLRELLLSKGFEVVCWEDDEIFQISW